MPAVTATGLEKVTDCHPESLSPVKVACARRVPLVDQRLPMWVPVFADDL